MMDKKYYFLEGDFVCCAKCEEERCGRSIRAFLNGGEELEDVKAYLVAKNGSVEEKSLILEDKNTYYSLGFSSEFDFETIVLSATNRLNGKTLYAFTGREKDLRRIKGIETAEEKEALEAAQEEEEEKDEIAAEGEIETPPPGTKGLKLPHYLRGREEAPPECPPFSEHFHDPGLGFAARRFDEVDVAKFPYSFLFLNKNPVSAAARRGGFYEGARGDLKVLGFLFEPEKEPFPLLHLATGCMVKVSKTDESIGCCFVGADMKQGKLVPVEF